MNHSAFCDILDGLNRGESPALVLSVNDREYLRRFTKTDRLILLGGGHVSLDVYRLARTLDFDVICVDDRPMFANSTRFPEATVICDDFVSAIHNLHISEGDYVCVLTRGHRWDAECVQTILSGTMPYYLGMISSKRRADGLRKVLQDRGFDRADIDRLHAPIGLKLGAITTAEIAVSICAELIKERAQRRQKPLDNELWQTDVNLNLLHYLAESKEARAVVTVISADGSTPVKSGSMMAVNRLGSTVGTVGGGCSEAAAISKARQIIGTGKNAVIEIDMSHEVAADNDMVCGGSMAVLIEDIT